VIIKDTLEKIVESQREELLSKRKEVICDQGFRPRPKAGIKKRPFRQKGARPHTHIT